MNARVDKLAIALGILTVTASCAVTSQSSNQTPQSPQVTAVSNKETLTIVKIDGSSTVHPITGAIAKKFQAQPRVNARVKVDISGTSGGFEKFCTGKTDINNASRPINQGEMKVCNENAIRYIELPVAFDAITVAVHPQNNWAKDITTAELKKIWEPDAEGKITRWNQVRSSFPNRPISLYGADVKSGTFDYFTKAIVGKSRASRKDYIASEDDNILVEGISKNPNALGYFGFAYYEINQNKLKALSVDNGAGAVLPSRQNVEQAKYQPLSRPLFIYVNAQAAQAKSAVKNFVDFYLQAAPTTVSSVGYVPLTAEGYKLDKVHFTRGKVGTVFAGKAELNLTIAELLRKQAQF
ncbi:MAG: PstS family phosphate ABC transporter substrate-binding protein [Calothrix sp. MO_167.B12]|nr:PstS family phosphate ABC transporter substrate-binding protein [Calothrix sp. MO_167.B12]